MSQKSRFKMQTQGITTFRNTFPQLPGGTLKNPEFIQTAHGQVFHRFPIYYVSYLRNFRNRLLISGWWRYSRKPVGWNLPTSQPINIVPLFRTTSPTGR